MLRNKIGKPAQTASNNETNKTTDNKTQTSQIPGMKVSGLIGSTGTGIKTPSLIGVKPLVKPSTGVTLPTPQKQINGSSQKQIQSQVQQKPQPTRPQQMKTQQQRLAQLVNKRAAQMKKEHQMINKISSQVGSEKKSYFKEYQTSYGHVLNTLGKKKAKQSCQNAPKQESKKGQNKKQNCQQVVMFKVNAWDDKNLLKQYLVDNFKKQNYL